MKKNSYWKKYVYLSLIPIKLLQIMKVTVLLMCMLTFSVSGSVYSQNTLLKLDVKGQTVRDVLKSIEKQSSFRFFYNDEFTDLNRSVTISADDKTIDDVLAKVFDNADVTYKVLENNLVVISPVSVVQQATIKGTITDSKGQPLPGVNVLVKGTTVGVISDIDGKYVINIPSDDAVLQFSYIGYLTEERPVKGLTVIDMVMVEDVKDLEEVVVIGYGVSKKRDLTGAVTSVKTDRIENEKPQAVQDLLRGNIAGLSVGFSTLAKGGGDLEVRGKNNVRSTSSNTPLFVLDGVIYQGAMEDINPNDIQSIDVLKDASSAAVYGAKAANGVVLITTKKGKSGKPVINVASSFGLATIATLQDVYDPEGFVNWRTDVLKSMNYYNPAINNKLYIYDNPSKLPSDVTEAMWRDGKTGDLTDIWLARIGFLPVEVANYKAGKTVNWNDMVFQNGLRQDHNISLSGKKDEVSYYGSVGYNKNEGVIVGDDFTTIRARLNVDANITKWLNVGINTQFANRDESNINADWGKIVSNSPYGSIYKDDGVTIRISPVDDLGRGAKHPLYDKMFQSRRKVYNTLINTLFANVKLPLGITYQVNFAPRFEWYNYLNHQSALHEEWSKFGGKAEREQKSIYSWQVDNLIKWNKTFNNIHQFDVTLLANAEKFQSWQNKMSTEGFTPTDALGYHNMTAGKSTSNILSSTDEYNTGSALMARLFYSLMNKYMVTLSVRRDGYSAFGQKHPYGTFPAAALAWVLSEEDFMKNNILTYAKLRLSWGLNGNREIGMYDALSDMNIGKYPYQPVSGSAYESNQLYVNRMANPDLRWEKTQAINIGFDFTITNGFLDGSVEYYKKNTKDLLIARGLPVFTGFSSVTSNIGEIQNTGFEATLNAKIMNKQNFSWNASGNFSLNRNQIKHLYGDMVDIKDANGNVIGQKEADDVGNKWFIGHDIDQIWEPKILGVWQKGQEDQAKVYGQYPGDFRLEDVDNSGKINQLDNQFQGYKTPRFRWTIRQDFTLFKNWNISMMAYSYWGHYGGYNQAKNRDGFPERVNSYIIPYWTPENSTNEYARIYSAEGGANFTVWRERSFIRLDNISVAYNVPQALLRKVSINSLKVFGTIRNVGYWAPQWDFWDPEQYRNENGDLTTGPTPRIYTVGINLSL